MIGAAEGGKGGGEELGVSCLWGGRCEESDELVDSGTQVVFYSGNEVLERL